MTIIGISGKRGSGKDTLGKVLINKYGFVKVSFAKRLKELAKEMYDLTNEQVDGMLKETIDPRYGITPRDILIGLGNDGRKYDPNVWIRLAFQGLPDGKYIVTDLRYKNEAKYLKDHGAMLVRLNRAKELNVYGVQELDTLSETDLDNYQFDLTVPKELNVTLNDLDNVALQVVNRLKGAEICPMLKLHVI